MISLLIKNNLPVAIAIGAFSILIPFVKLLFTLFLLIFSVKGAKRLRKVLSFIAKWSMADVFVVAAFLAYLSFSNIGPDQAIWFGAVIILPDPLACCCWTVCGATMY